MILEILWLFLVIGLILIWLGYSKNTAPYGIVGFAFIFLIGIPMFTNNLEYKSGSIITTSGTTTTVTNTYSTITDTRIYGVFLEAITALGIIFILIDRNREKRAEAELNE